MGKAGAVNSAEWKATEHLYVNSVLLFYSSRLQLAALLNKKQIVIKAGEEEEKFKKSWICHLESSSNPYYGDN